MEIGNGSTQDILLFSLSNYVSGLPDNDIWVNGVIALNLKSYRQLNLNVWEHVAFVLDLNRKAYVYVNGELTGQAGSSTLARNLYRTNNYIGKSSWSVDENADADLDELKIFNRGLSQKEIQNEMNIDNFKF